MVETIPNLWSARELKQKVLTPIAILRAQAAQLSPMTHGMLRAEVTTLRAEKQDVLGLEIIAPALHNYRHRLLNVQYTRDEYYPAKVSANGLTVTRIVKNQRTSAESQLTSEVTELTAYTETELIDILRQALQAPQNIAMLQSLIARSNEVKDTEAITEVSSNNTQEAPMPAPDDEE